MSESPITFFAKEVIATWRGRKCVALVAARGILDKAILPLAVVYFMGTIGSPRAALTAGWLIGLVVALSLFASYQERQVAHLIDQLKYEQRDRLATMVRVSPYSNTGGSTKTIVSRFLSAQIAGMWLVLEDAITLAIGLPAFILVLLFYHMPWWVVGLIATALLVALSPYWAKDKFVLFNKAGDLESEVGDCLAELCDARNNHQVQPAVVRTVKALNKKALKAREKSTLYTLRRYHDVRHAINIVLCSGAIGAALAVNDQQTAVLLVVFMFTSSAQIFSIHRMTTDLTLVENDGRPLLDRVLTPPKPIIEPDPAQICLQTSQLAIHYFDKEGKLDTVVPVPDMQLKAGGLYVFTGRNGIGKSSFFKAVCGAATFAGKLEVWGQPANGFDCSMAISGFWQDRQGFTATVQDLFRNEALDYDKEVMQYALNCVNGEDIDLEKLHITLSDGQQQKVDLALAIYRAIVCQTALVIIDEPTNNLDRPSAIRVRQELPRFLGSLGSTITTLIAAHDIPLQDALLALPQSHEIS